MRAVDVVALLRVIAELQPAQRITTYTPDTWSMVLETTPATLDEATAAVVRLAAAKDFFTAHDVRTEIRKAKRPAELAPPAPARKALDWNRNVLEARRARNARGKAAAVAAIRRPPFASRLGGAALSPKVAAALAAYRAEQAAADAENPAMSVEDAVTQFRHQQTPETS